MSSTSITHGKAIIGNTDSSFWLYDSLTGFDLTHPRTPSSPTVHNAVRIKTAQLPVTIDPAKSAIVVVDMQNFFLSTALGRSPKSNGLMAQTQLLQYAIPAARKAGIRIVWLNWGLTDEELLTMPSAVIRAFGFETVEVSQFQAYLESNNSSSLNQSHTKDASVDSRKTEIETFGKDKKQYQALGNHMGPVTLADGSVIEAGRQLMRDQWNTALTPELSQSYQEGLKSDPPDVWIHKNRMSGLWGSSTSCSEFLDEHGIKTLFFAGVNTDQCVGGTLTDAFSKGYDCILLKDGSATTSPESCQEAWEFNSAGTFGFSVSCKDLWEGVEAHQEKTGH